MRDEHAQVGTSDRSRSWTLPGWRGAARPAVRSTAAQARVTAALARAMAQTTRAAPASPSRAVSVPGSREHRGVVARSRKGTSMSHTTHADPRGQRSKTSSVVVNFTAAARARGQRRAGGTRGHGRLARAAAGAGHRHDAHPAILIQRAAAGPPCVPGRLLRYTPAVPAFSSGPLSSRPSHSSSIACASTRRAPRRHASCRPRARPRRRRGGAQGRRAPELAADNFKRAQDDLAQAEALVAKRSAIHRGAALRRPGATAEGDRPRAIAPAWSREMKRGGLTPGAAAGPQAPPPACARRKRTSDASRSASSCCSATSR